MSDEYIIYTRKDDKSGNNYVVRSDLRESAHDRFEFVVPENGYIKIADLACIQNCGYPLRIIIHDESNNVVVEGRENELLPVILKSSVNYHLHFVVEGINLSVLQTEGSHSSPSNIVMTMYLSPVKTSILPLLFISILALTVVRGLK